MLASLCIRIHREAQLSAMCTKNAPHSHSCYPPWLIPDQTLDSWHFVHSRSNPGTPIVSNLFALHRKNPCTMYGRVKRKRRGMFYMCDFETVNMWIEGVSSTEFRAMPGLAFLHTYSALLLILIFSLSFRVQQSVLMRADWHPAVLVSGHKITNRHWCWLVSNLPFLWGRHPRPVENFSSLSLIFSASGF